MKKKLLILNGVNLNLLGTREVNVYGYTSFDTYFKQLQDAFQEVELSYFQSDSLEEIVKQIHDSSRFDGVILNPGAYTHTAIVLADAIKSVNVPVVEVHISNLFGRENYRKKSMISANCVGFVSGFGLKGYQLAIQSFLL